MGIFFAKHIAAVPSAVFALGLCGGEAAAETVVGIAGPLSGNVALNGEQQDLGAQRAIFDLNAAVAAGFILEKFAYRRIALLHDGNTDGKGLVEGVKAELNAAGKQEAHFASFEGDQISYAATKGSPPCESRNWA